VKKSTERIKPEGRAVWRNFRAHPLKSKHCIPSPLHYICLSPWMITGNLKERILKFRKTVHPSGSRDTKANFFTAYYDLFLYGVEFYLRG